MGIFVNYPFITNVMWGRYIRLGITIFCTAIVFILWQSKTYAQNTVSGCIADVQTNKPVYGARVINKSTGNFVNSSIDGMYAINAKNTDVLAFTKEGYLSITIQLDSTINGQLDIQLLQKGREGIEQLPAVTVYGNSYQKDSIRLRKEFEAYFPQGPVQFDEIVRSNGQVDLNALIARIQTPRDAEFARAIIALEKDRFIDHYFTSSRVKSMINISDQDLPRFMKRYRPPYAFLVKASLYELIKYVKDSYKEFLAFKKIKGRN